MAGQEPPSAALTWLLDRLGREPEAAERFAASDPAASTAPDHLATTSFDADPDRDACVREALRLRPPVHSIMRRLTRPAVIAGRPLPGGVVAMAPMILLHRDPGAFPDAVRFDPGRWHDGGAGGGAFLPFGGGPRRCLGEPLARAQIATVLPAVLRRVRLAPLAPQPERMLIRGTVTMPRHGALVVARDR